MNQNPEPKRQKGLRYWLGPTFGVLMLVIVQIAFVGIAAWPLLLGDEFLRHERVEIVARWQGGQPRWVVRMANKRTIDMPPPEELTFDEPGPICVKVLEGPYGNQKARLAEIGACVKADQGSD